MKLEQSDCAVKDMAQRVRQGIDAPDKAARDALQKINALDGVLHAWAHVIKPDDLPLLLDQEALDGPLAGVPVGVKDVINVAGMPTRCGSSACNDTESQFDAASVSLLRAAGAIPIGKTVTAEFAYRTPGLTRNPVNVEYTPGGSSSGSAAAVAAGMVPIAMGTQTGGSMIRPAAFCGVVGFKPTFGSVHRDGMKLTCDSLDTIGWYGRTVADVEAVAQVLLPQCSPVQGNSLDEPVLLTMPQHQQVSLDALCVAYIPSLFPQDGPEPEASNALEIAAAQLGNSGAQVRVIEAVADLQLLVEAHSVIMHYEFARSLAPVVRLQQHNLSAVLVDAVDRGGKIAHGQYLDMKTIQTEFRGRWNDLFSDADMILTPSAPGAAPHGINTTGSSRFNVIWTLLGWPCLHLPTSLSGNGLPLGVQLVGKPNSDAGLLSWAEPIHQAIDRRL